MIVGDGQFEFRIVGEMPFQHELGRLTGPRTEEGCHQKCAALLVPEPNNPHDRNAIAVFIHDVQVGYLSHEVCREFLEALFKGGYSQAAAEAVIVGGWHGRHGQEDGFYGVRLNACLPFKLKTALL
jgi:hypothetical protein